MVIKRNEDLIEDPDLERRLLGTDFQIYRPLCKDYLTLNNLEKMMA